VSITKALRVTELLQLVTSFTHRICELSGNGGYKERWILMQFKL